MTMFLAPYTAIADIDGSPLDAGFLFFGEYGKDPELFPVEVFWDSEFTVPAAQPIRTRNGYPVRNGSPTKVYLKTAQHSIVIKNRNGAFILVDFKNKGWDASFVVDGSGKTQQEINNINEYIRSKQRRNLAEFGDVVQDQATDHTTLVLSALSQLQEGECLYIPRNVKWEATSNPLAVYDAMPDNTILEDDSGYESRYSYANPADRWQASQQIYYKTKDYGAAGRRNGNGLNIRSDYHSYLNYEIDAQFGTEGCKGSVIFRFNNGTDEMLQIGANGDSATQGHLGIASYGDYSNGVSALRMGMQSSNAPHSFAFNSAMIDGTSYIFGKRIRKTNPLYPETEAEWQSAGHVTRYSQPSGHTGNFDRLFYYGSSVARREILEETGRYRVVTKNSKTLTTTADGEQFGAKLSVLTPTSNLTLTESLSGSYYSNVSTGGTLTLTLPKAIKGTYFEFSVDVAQNLVIAPNAADNFTGMATGKTKTSNAINSKIRVVAISAAQWSFVQSGTWTDES